MARLNFFILILILFISAPFSYSEDAVQAPLSQMRVKIVFKDQQGTANIEIKEYTDRIVINDNVHSKKTNYDRSGEMTKKDYQDMWTWITENIDLWSLNKNEVVSQGNGFIEFFFEKEGKKIVFYESEPFSKEGKSLIDLLTFTVIRSIGPYNEK